MNPSRSQSSFYWNYFILTTFLFRISYGTSIYDFEVLDGDGTKITLHKFREKPVILIVNVASQCGFTESNYKELQELYDTYANKGLEILAFPCNQFGGQEPQNIGEIKDFVINNYRVQFPIFSKIDVNGPNESPLFTYLKKELHGTLTNDIKWNFTKFLIVNGEPFHRYATTTSPKEIENDIKRALGLNKDDL